MTTIEIDDDLYALELPIQDRVALATMRAQPRIGNGALAKLLGVSDSGIRTLIRRFKSSEMLRVLRMDGRREFKVLVGDQNRGQNGCQKMTKIGNPEIRQKVTDEPSPALSAEERAHWKLDYFHK